MARTKPQAGAHEELDRLRGLAGNERMKGRDLAHRLEVAQLKAREAEQAIEAGYEAEDSDAVDAARGSLREAEAEAEDLGHRVRAAEARAATAQHVADAFIEAHADDLIAEVVAQAEQATQRLSTHVLDALKAHRDLLDLRQQQDHLIAASGGEPRLDGPEASHPWERALLDLERVTKQHPGLEPPRPRWDGRRAAAQRDAIARHLQEQRA